MDAILLMVVPFVGYILAYRIYGRFLARKIFRLDRNASVPSRELQDGIDYVPARKEIIFGHHYTSIAGTGPIVGPAIGVIWGWVPAILWIFLGSILMGAVHDFGALVVSMRNQGKSLSEVTGRYINPRVRTIFFLIVFFELWIVIAIFAMIIAILFGMYPRSIFPIWMEIPIAVTLGYIVYKRNGNVTLFTVLAVLAMYITVAAGYFLPVKIPSLLGLPPTGVWIIILFIYAYIASTLPVTTLLEPRDYINAWQLFVVMLLMTMGVLVSGFLGRLHIAAPAFQLSPAEAPPVWPFLFITIACGAISGFHSLVSSGTSSKQVSSEPDALFVGYGSMLMEAALATLVIVAVAAGIGIGYTAKSGLMLTGSAAWNAHYSSWAAAGGLGAKIGAFVTGSVNMMSYIGIPLGLGMIIMGVFIVSFAGTTLDTATRIQRYVISELATHLKLPVLPNRWVATMVAVVIAAILAFATGAHGKGALTLWPLFGAVNQLLAALALLVVTLYLKSKGGDNYLVTAIPCAFMLVLTIWAMLLNERNFILRSDWLLVVVNGATLALALWMTVEALLTLFKPRSSRTETATG